MPDIPAVVQNMLSGRRIYGVGADAIRRDWCSRRRAQPSVAVESCPVRVGVGGRDQRGRRRSRRGESKHEEDRANGEGEPPEHGECTTTAPKYPLNVSLRNGSKLHPQSKSMKETRGLLKKSPKIRPANNSLPPNRARKGPFRERGARHLYGERGRCRP